MSDSVPQIQRAKLPFLMRTREIKKLNKTRRAAGKRSEGAGRRAELERTEHVRIKGGRKKLNISVKCQMFSG